MDGFPEALVKAARIWDEHRRREERAFARIVRVVVEAERGRVRLLAAAFRPLSDPAE